MPIFVCDKCHAIDNTACGGNYWENLLKPQKERVNLCAECHTGKWHGRFEKNMFDAAVHHESDFIYIPKLCFSMIENGGTP